MSNLTEMGELAKKASRELEGCTCKNEALYAIADSLVARADEILKANEADMKAAEEKGVGMRAKSLERFDVAGLIACRTSESK